MRAFQLLLISIVTLCALTAQAQTTATLRELRTIMIDPGHGGEDSGAVGVAEVDEKDLTLAVALALRDELLRRDPTLIVLMSRETDTYPTLNDRTRQANAEHADVLVSLHFNASTNAEANGVETYFIATEGTRPGDLVPGREEDGPALPYQEVGVVGTLRSVVVDDLVRDGAIRESALLAETIQRSLIDVTGARDREVRQAQFRVLRGVRMPAVVVELGFLTHPDEGQRVLDPAYQATMVQALADALVDYDARQQSTMAELGVYELEPESVPWVAAQ